MLGCGGDDPSRLLRVTGQTEVDTDLIAQNSAKALVQIQWIRLVDRVAAVPAQQKPVAASSAISHAVCTINPDAKGAGADRSVLVARQKPVCMWRCGLEAMPKPGSLS